MAGATKTALCYLLLDFFYERNKLLSYLSHYYFGFLLHVDKLSLQTRQEADRERERII